MSVKKPSQAAKRAADRILKETVVSLVCKEERDGIAAIIDEEIAETREALRQAEFSDWDQVPKGLMILRANHERTGSNCLHLKLKLNDGPWYDQPSVPTYSQEAMKDRYFEFWKWAEGNLPIWNYPEVIKSCY